MCREWKLNAEEAERFFSLSREVDVATYYHDYDTAPCKIDGVAHAWGRVWQLTINGAAKATLSSGNEVKYFGCEEEACESLVMWMPERTEPPIE